MDEDEHVDEYLLAIPAQTHPLYEAVHQPMLQDESFRCVPHVKVPGDERQAPERRRILSRMVGRPDRIVRVELVAIVSLPDEALYQFFRKLSRSCAASTIS
jgi:hypothetical protein